MVIRPTVICSLTTKYEIFKIVPKLPFVSAPRNTKLEEAYKRPFVFLLQTMKIELKGALSGLRQFLTAESSLKMMKNVFYFTLKALFVIKIFKFLS